MMRPRALVAVHLVASLCGCFTVRQPQPDDGKPHGRPGGDEDATNLGGGDAGEPPPGEGAKHPACRFARADALEPVPWLRRDEAGDPLVDAWRKLDCSTVAQVLECDADSQCPFSIGHCLLDSPNATRGVCVRAVACGEGVPVTFRDGACSVCTDVESKAALCCAGAKGIDCRGLPFAATSGPGQACFEHGDCEPGLVCDNASPESFPVCVCPGVTPWQLSQVEGCAFNTYSKGWGEARPSSPAPCRELGSGWFDLLLATDINPYQSYQPARGPDGVSYLAVGGQSLRIFALRNGTWTLEADRDDTGLSPRIAVDTRGAIHVVNWSLLGGEAESRLGIRHLTNVSGQWTSEWIVDSPLPPLDFTFDDVGTPWIVTGVIGGEDGGDVITQRDGMWVVEEYAPRNGSFPSEARLVFSGDGTPHVVWQNGALLVLVAVRGVDGWESTPFDLSARQTAFDCAFARASDKTPWFACDATENGSSQGGVWLAPFLADRAEPDVAFVHRDGRFEVEATRPSLVLDALDRPMVLHRSPQGLRIATRDGAGWTSEVVMPQVPETAKLVLDATGAPHILYAESVDPSLGFGDGVLRVMARGTCPRP